MKVIKNGTVPSVPGPSDYFTGTVRIDAPFSGTDPARISGATVTFEPKARTAWHAHPYGQILIVTSGKGWVQKQGDAAQEINPGDIVWIAPNEKHWQGAAADTALTHIAIAETLDGSPVTWMEPVTDDQYPESDSGLC